MTTEILLINPRKKTRKRRSTKKTAAKKRVRRATARRTTKKTPTRRRTTRRAAPSRTTAKRRITTMAKKRKYTKKRKAPRKNPRRIVRRAASRARSTFAGLNIKSALKDVPITQFGMFATKWFAKRFGPEALEGDPGTWNWSSYLKGGIGAVAAGFVAQIIKPGSGQKALAGGLNLIAYKLIQNQFVQGNAWAAGQFGEDEGYMPDEYMEGADGGYLPGEIEQDASGRSYLLGDDRQWHALPSSSPMMGDVLEPVGRLGLTEPLVPVGPLGQDNYDALYRNAILDS